MEPSTVVRQVRDVADEFAAERRERQLRRQLDGRDFDRLVDAGFLTTGLPVARDGLWETLPASTRPICEILRALARADSSVALVASMHPAVLSFWLALPEVPAPDTEAWARQREEVFETVVEGSWWGTITSEPGSGGDVANSRATARVADGQHRLHGQKHFGSGSGVTSYMITTAVPEGEDEPDWFFLHVAGVPWDGSAGARLVAPWDGHGMVATQSHAMAFDGFPVERLAWPAHLEEVIGAAAPFVGSAFTAVIVGIVDVAVETARLQLAAKRDEMRPFERVEWARAERDGWAVDQLYDGMLRAVESGAPARGAVVRAKTAIAELAESTLQRICRVIGGGTFARQSPFGHWFEDVRALGFLRPPWGLALDGLFEESFEPAPSP